METLMNINSVVNNFVWGPPILVLIVGVGLFCLLKPDFSLLLNLATLKHFAKNVF